MSPKQIKDFQKEILDWFAINKRDLPWRKNKDPYSILISEVMLQQTQVSRVIPKFHTWMQVFPTLKSLAKASTRDVLLYWSGLGYNRRALYLKSLAEELIKNYKGMFPQDEKELRKLPGIGEYTARALLCFAFDKQIAVVDTNVRKVILTKLKIKDTKKDIQEIADLLLPQGRAYEWNQALMDYASDVLKKERIAIPRQSPFKSSKRFYRGQVLRLLLVERKTLAGLFKKIINNGITKDRFEDILSDMQKDGLILKDGRFFNIPL